MSDVQTPAFAPELRHAYAPLVGVEWRESGAGDGSVTLLGHAAVFNQTTSLYRGKTFEVLERIDAGAFSAVLASKPDVHLNIGHDMNRVIARTGIAGVGGLDFSEDGEGLRVWARLDESDPDVQALQKKMSRGIIDQMSFAFRVGSDSLVTTTEEDGFESDLRTIITVSDLYDVCACAQGAYPQTSASLRSLLAAVGRGDSDSPGLGGESPRRAALDGSDSTIVAPLEAGGDAERRRRVAAAKAHTRRRVITLSLEPKDHR